ncbi:MAG: hypothetical protein HYX75_20900 [Acidobacteria bacterium]|nr:hypothetical protein [Acidobacteriota bacterium]
MILASLLAAVLILAWGGAGALVAGGLARRLGAAEFFGLSTLAGASLVITWSLLMMTFHLPFAILSSVGVLLIAGLAGYGEWRDRLSRIAAHRPVRAEIILALLLLPAAAKVFAEVQLLPLTGWDSRIIWGFKAKVLSAEGTVLAPAFTDPYRIHLHPKYPIGVPILQSYFAAIGPADDDRMFKAPIALFGLVAPILLWGVMRRSAGGGFPAVLGPALLTYLPLWVSALEVSLPEVVSGCLQLAAAGLFLRWTDDGDIFWAAWGMLFAVQSALCKQEGMVFLIIYGILVFVHFLRKTAPHPPAGSIALVPATIAVCGALSWIALSRHLPIVSTVDYAGIVLNGEWTCSAGKLTLILLELGAIIASPSSWGFLFPLAAAAAVTLDGRLMWLTLLIAAYALAFVPVFVLSPWQPLEPHIRIALPRILLQIAPLAVLLIGERMRQSGWTLHSAPR